MKGWMGCVSKGDSEQQDGESTHDSEDIHSNHVAQSVPAASKSDLIFYTIMWSIVLCEISWFLSVGLKF